MSKTNAIKALKQWLGTQIRQIGIVRVAGIDQRGDLIINTHMGGQAKIYLLDRVPTLRDLKRMLKNNDRDGIGTLFVVKRELMPANKARFIPTEWMSFLHALGNKRIFAYQFDDGEPLIRPLHLSIVDARPESELWEGPVVAFEQMRVYRFSPKVSQLSGSWMVADFGWLPFWEQATYRAERIRYEGRSQAYFRWQRSQGAAGWFHTQDGGEPGAMPTRREIDKLYRALGVGMESSKDEVKAAYRKLAMQVHPDVSSLPKDEAEKRFHALTEAYERIREYRGWV